MKSRQKKKRYSKLILGFVCTIVALLAIVISTIIFGRFTSKEHAMLYIDNDDNIDSVYTKLEATAGPCKIGTFKFLCSLRGYSKKILPGRYDVGEGKGTYTVVQNLRHGLQTPLKLTIPQTHTVDMLAEKIAKKLRCSEDELKAAFHNKALQEKCGVNDTTIAALFIPDTYEIYWTITPEQFVERMKKEYDIFWNSKRLSKAKDIGLTPIEVSTLASIIDRETNDKEDMPIIAGLYMNRLKKGMKLESCPTAIFAIGDFTMRRVLKQHTMHESPYNTYLHAGLPPGPIYLPRPICIDAVLNYNHNDFLFMCARADRSGKHHFSKTYEEHAKYGKIYAEYLNQRNIKK